ncbi:G-type lectin S-receptor-like serine/threonine-protein kinase SD2-5 isoform X1 [Quercus robur]|uniref:G-type lectin S-receptor-like serine/threonine-protein kinase SD2-5 isoform X1 n=1 Tax=Quercus robur TaxID=38942 RepID=UPI00216215D4|nr:G-type lectin S-receptor-like serine/threonine-protein kinase SD2-5 isoform X1 [Quercus robur]
MGWACCTVLLYLVLFPIIVLAESYLTVNSSTTSWTNREPVGDLLKADAVIIFASRSSVDPDYGNACFWGFFCDQTCNSSRFATFFLNDDPRVLWSANPKNPVSIDATLKLNSERGLVLQDADGTIAWSTNISTKSVAALNLTDNCNLMLLDENNATIWQSFDLQYGPFDVLFYGQKLVPGQQLTSEGGLFSLSLTSEGLFASINSNPPLRYWNYQPADTISYVQFLNQGLSFYGVNNDLFANSLDKLSIPSTSLSLRYMRFGPDGHLRVYDQAWKEVADLLKFTDLCSYPTVCGNYGICTNGQCGCLRPINGISYFQQIEGRQPDRGCFPITPLSCEASKTHILLELQNITYIPFKDIIPFISELKPISLGNCKQACLKNCSCKAAIYYSTGYCYLLSEIFSLNSTTIENTYHKVYIKVQNYVPSVVPPLQPTNHEKKKRSLRIIMGSSLGSLLFLFLIGIFVFRIRNKENADEAEEYYLDHVPGMPTRYSYDDLRTITKNFSKELGGGGFGTVFEGTLIDSTKVAVKRLDGFSQIKKSFLAEVETIGNTHHFNLVRLIGFCAEKFQRLLVYEYMSNGSLDRWIFNKNSEMLLDWKLRKKIMIDIARGLTYLHEECRQKIVHMDIKPHNILLDENFNAKVSDFGLSRLVDRDQSQVVTTMRGTPGYMAPEWLSSVITEKVDVYSFGIVLLEILCGRRNFDRSQPEEAMHLVDLFKNKIEGDRLVDLVDKHSEDMQLHGEEVVNMMRVATWCLQNDFTKRPSMSMVVKVFEGVVNVESDLDYFFSNPHLLNPRTGVDNQEVQVVATTPLFPSVLSGPR